MTKKTSLKLGDRTVDLPITVGSENEKALDIGSLRKETGYITLDPSYANTGSCKSNITFIDGEKGILRYRGYPIEDLAKNARFSEIAYLLINGELPNKEELEFFSNQLTYHSLIHEDMKKFFDR